MKRLRYVNDGQEVMIPIPGRNESPAFGTVACAAGDRARIKFADGSESWFNVNDLVDPAEHARAQIANEQDAPSPRWKGAKSK